MHGMSSSGTSEIHSFFSRDRCMIDAGSVLSFLQLSSVRCSSAVILPMVSGISCSSYNHSSVSSLSTPRLPIPLGSALSLLQFLIVKLPRASAVSPIRSGGGAQAAHACGVQ